MSKKTYNQVIKTVLTTVVGLSVSHSLLIPTAKANEYKPKNTVNPVAVKSIPEVDLLNTRLYEHRLANRDVITLRFKDIPLFTFWSAPNYDAKQTAIEVAQTLEQLAQESIDANEITVIWNQKTKDYSINYQDQELVRLNKYVQIPDRTNNLSHDALQATNRLRRLMGNAEPLTEVQGKTKLLVNKRNQMAAVVDIKNQGKTYTGKASWYGPGFHGRRTASGQIFNQNALTAAHRHLPFGTKVKVTNMRNGRSVIVTINDRGPFSGSRILDLSAAAAQTIGMKSTGVAQIEMQVLGY